MASELGSQDRVAVSTEVISIPEGTLSCRAKVLTKRDDEMLNGMFGDWLVLVVELSEKRPMKALVKGNSQLVGICLEITPGTRIDDRDEPSFVSLSADPEGSIIDRFPGGGGRFRLAQHAPQQQAYQRSIAVGRVAPMTDRWYRIEDELEFSRTQCDRARGRIVTTKLTLWVTICIRRMRQQSIRPRHFLSHAALTSWMC